MLFSVIPKTLSYNSDCSLLSAMKASILAIVVLASFAAVVVQPHEADACGGCVAPTGAFTAVQSHRMVMKLGINETILWDQFTYTGAPEEFAWILPVPSPDTIVEVAEADFIDVIDQESTPIVLSPPCGEAAGCGGGCGSFSNPNWKAIASTVTVHKHEMVGPYETAVIGSDDPLALTAWLSENDYAFPQNGLPILNYYTEKESTFVVLRLRPGVDVSAMQPVRVRFQGYMGIFPLRMIALGAAGVVEMSLWIVADQRYEPMNYATTRIYGEELVWDSETESSNYEEVFDRTILDAGGRAWVTESAQIYEGSALQAALQEKVPQESVIMAANLHAPFITRLRSRMLVDYLSEDLLLAPAIDASEVSRELIAGVSTDGAECNQEVEASGTSFSITGQSAQSAIWAALTLLALLLLSLRRRRKNAYAL